MKKIIGSLFLTIAITTTSSSVVACTNNIPVCHFTGMSFQGDEKNPQYSELNFFFDNIMGKGADTITEIKNYKIQEIDSTGQQVTPEDTIKITSIESSGIIFNNGITYLVELNREIKINSYLQVTFHGETHKTQVVPDHNLVATMNNASAILLSGVLYNFVVSFEGYEDPQVVAKLFYFPNYPDTIFKIINSDHYSYQYRYFFSFDHQPDWTDKKLTIHYKTPNAPEQSVPVSVLSN